jgi:excisionase family DNA binding protein
VAELSEIKRALSVDETAAHAGVGRDAIYAAIRNGELVARKLGRRTLILRSDLDRFLRRTSSAR